MDRANNHILFVSSNYSCSLNYNNDFFYETILENFEKNNKNVYSKNAQKLIKLICYYIEEVGKNELYFIISNNCSKNDSLPYIKILNKDHSLIESILFEIKNVLFPYYTLKISKKINGDDYDFIVVPQFQF